MGMVAHLAMEYSYRLSVPTSHGCSTLNLALIGQADVDGWMIEDANTMSSPFELHRLGELKIG